MCEILVLENGQGTYWGSVVGLLGSIETPFEMCGHEFKLELVGIVDVVLRTRLNEWQFLIHGRCSKMLTSYFCDHLNS